MTRPTETETTGSRTEATQPATQRTVEPGAVRRNLRALADLLVLPLALFVLWWIAATVVESSVFPNPVNAMRGLAADLGQPEFRESLYTTVWLLVQGWVLAAVVGALVGFGLGLSKFWSEVFATPLSALYSVPKVTLYPIFLLFLGIGETSRVAFAFFHGVFPMALLVMAATAAIDEKLLKLSRALVLPWHVKLRKILIPALLPTLVTGLRIAFGLTIMGLLLAGMFSAHTGLGHELVANITHVRIDHIAGQVVLIAAIAVIPGLALRWLENRVTARYQQD